MSPVKKLKKYLESLRLVLIFLCGIVFILILFPKEGKFRYEFQKGKPWLHQILIAPFDFPIYKTEAVLQSERDSVLKKFIPYFRMDSMVSVRIFGLFDQSFESNWQSHWSSKQSASSPGIRNVIPFYNRTLLRIKDSYYQGIKAVLNQLYQKGIILDPVQIDKMKANKESINFISGKLVEERSAATVFTQKTAYEFLKSETDKLGSLIEPYRRSADRFITTFELINFIEPNLSYDVETSTKMRQNLLDQMSLTQGMMQAGEKIIALGELVNDEKFQILQSLKTEYETNPSVSRNYNLIILGQILLVTFSFLVLYLFLLNFRKEVLSRPIHTFFIVMLIMIIASLAALTINNERISLYVVPIVIVPIILKTFYDSKIAILVHVLTILILGFWAPNGFEFVFMNFIAGVITIFTLRDMFRRGVLFISAVFTFLTYGLIYTAMGLMQEGRFENLELNNYAWFGGNALLVLTSYPLIYIFEKIFGFLSDATLIELADTNQPMLRKLAEQAPGTFQHSLQVANLAEEGALKVGGNSLLVRTGAIYHDIGKLDDPIYFIENQTSLFNPHDNLIFEESARKIIEHVAKGVEYARKINLPDLLVDFIRTHHGTTTVQYFYRSFLNKYPEIEINPKKFIYPGPKPYSKETAILMMADSIEAASRSLKLIDTDTINKLVDEIINSQFDEKQFENVDLTFRDIEILKQVFKDKLLNIYHARIEYPK